jgi:membrane-bound lytic murein transglycosylase D
LRSRSLFVVTLTALLGACATPGPEPTPSVAEPRVVAAPIAPAVADEEVAVAPDEPPAPGATSIPGDAEAELEPLAPPEEDLWDRIRKGFALPDLEGPLVEKWEQWYVARPDYVARMVERSRRYLYYIVAEVEQRAMPLEIALLPMVESAYNPNALSTSRASGIWQFIPSTGARRDVVAATDGALNYLQKLHADFDDWQLALAAYNWGEGNVARALAANQKAGRPGDYASLNMPDETRNYLPKLQAVKNIVRDPQKYGLDLGDIPDAPYFAVVRTSKKIDVRRAAELAEMSVEEFQYLNPQHNRPVIAGADQHTLLLPIDRAELFAAKLELTDQPLVSWQAHRMRPGETLPQLAARFGMSVETLRAVNGIGRKATVHVGHMLLVPAQLSAKEAADSLASAVFTAAPQGRTFYYRVRRGDSLSSIAARYSVSMQDLRRWNGMVRRQGQGRPGQRQGEGRARGRESECQTRRQWQWQRQRERQRHPAIGHGLVGTAGVAAGELDPIGPCPFARGHPAHRARRRGPK